MLGWSSAEDNGEFDRTGATATSTSCVGSDLDLSDGYKATSQNEAINEGRSITDAALPSGYREDGEGSVTDGVEGNTRSVDRRIKKVRSETDGLQDLMRLGIFLDSHEVQEDTVDVLSSAGYL